jgi:hypothetical protein
MSIPFLFDPFLTDDPVNAILSFELKVILVYSHIFVKQLSFQAQTAPDLLLPRSDVFLLTDISADHFDPSADLLIINCVGHRVTKPDLT